MPLYLTQSLPRAVQRHPQRTATTFGSRERSYAEHADRVARLAGALHALGVSRGDRIGMLGLNSDRYLEFFYGCWWAGAAVNPVNVRWSAGEIAYSLDDCDTPVLLVDEPFKGLVGELRSRSRALQTIVYTGDGPVPERMLGFEALLAAADPVADVGACGQDLAAAMYTGRMDEDGYVHIVDRPKDMIVTGGENVYSAEVENALAQHPAVAASAVIGIPSDAWGEAVHAAVVLKPGASAPAKAEDLMAHCRGLIAGYKCPRSVEFRDALPMTGAGKVQKTALRKLHWEGRSRAVN